MLAFFYLNYFTWIERLYFNKKQMNYILIVLCFYIASVLITFLIPGGRHQDEEGFPALFFGSRLYVFLFVLMLPLLIRIWQRLKLTQAEKTVTELSFLKSQINPHFL